MFLRALTSTLGLLVALPAAAYTIDGNLGDWNINPATFVSGNTLKGYTIDTDSTGLAGANVFPGQGGQAYDAEALYIDRDSSTLYLAMITGHNPTTQNVGNTSYATGDFLIDFGRDGVFEYGLKTTGDSKGHLFKIGLGDVKLGLFKDQLTPLGQLTPYLEHRNAVSTTGGIDKGIGTLMTSTLLDKYGIVSATDKHYAYEASIAINLFDPQYWYLPFDVQWTMQCGNDVISADPVPSLVPEPMSLALFGIALAGLGSTRRRSKSAS